MFVLRIRTDSAAFGDDNQAKYYELARIMEVIARQLRDGGDGVVCRKVRDENGNTVGEWHFED